MTAETQAKLFAAASSLQRELCAYLADPTAVTLESLNAFATLLESVSMDPALSQKARDALDRASHWLALARSYTEADAVKSHPPQETAA